MGGKSFEEGTKTIGVVCTVCNGLYITRSSDCEYVWTCTVVTSIRRAWWRGDRQEPVLYYSFDGEKTGSLNMKYHVVIPQLTKRPVSAAVRNHKCCIRLVVRRPASGEMCGSTTCVGTCGSIVPYYLSMAETGYFSNEIACTFAVAHNPSCFSTC